MRKRTYVGGHAQSTIHIRIHPFIVLRLLLLLLLLRPTSCNTFMLQRFELVADIAAVHHSPPATHCTQRQRSCIICRRRLNASATKRGVDSSSFSFLLIPISRSPGSLLALYYIHGIASSTPRESSQAFGTALPFGKMILMIF